MYHNIVISLTAALFVTSSQAQVPQDWSWAKESTRPLLAARSGDSQIEPQLVRRGLMPWSSIRPISSPRPLPRTSPHVDRIPGATLQRTSNLGWTASNAPAVGLRNVKAKATTEEILRFCAGGAVFLSVTACLNQLVSAGDLEKLILADDRCKFSPKPLPGSTISKERKEEMWRRIREESSQHPGYKALMNGDDRRPSQSKREKELASTKNSQKD